MADPCRVVHANIPNEDRDLGEALGEALGSPAAASMGVVKASTSTMSAS